LKKTIRASKGARIAWEQRTQAPSESLIVDLGGVRITESALDFIWRNVGRATTLTVSSAEVVYARNQWSWNQPELDNLNEYLDTWEIESKLGFAVPMNHHQIQPEHVQFDEIKDEHIIQRIEQRLGIGREKLQTLEGREQVRKTLQSYIDEAIVRFKQHALVRETDEDGNERTVRKAKDGNQLNNSVYISGGGAVVIEISDDAKIVTFYTAKEYSQGDKDTDLVIKVVKRCNTETLDISIPPEEL